MALPFNYTVPSNAVAIYGSFPNSLSGMIPDNSDFVFGYVYQIGQDVYNVAPNDYVMYNYRNQEVRLLFDNKPYVIIEAAKLAGIDKEPL
jgi:hypothetical protein